MVWLEKRYGRRWPFDMVVLDEASSFKHHSTQRFKALRRMRPHINRAVELTGTPAPKDYMDLWAQVYLLDQGQRLGQRFTQYRDNYFQPDKRNGMQIYSWKPRKGAEEAIQAKLADVAISIQAADHLQLPEKIIEDIPVVLPPKDWDTYQEMQNQRLLEVDTETITAMQAATLTGKLLQLCNGAMYDAEKQVHPLNRCKLDAFDELIDALDGQRALVFYAFEFDKEFLQAELKTRERGLSFAVLKGREEADAWNRGELDVLLAQPASCAYGLNLQAGGHHLIWYSLPWNLELYEQGNARLYRQGQQQPVIIHRLLVKNGADEVDMVINIGMLKDGRDDEVLAEINAIKAACAGHPLKVIIETCLLTEEEKIRMCDIVSQSDADFIKTSTGFSTAGATFDDVALMKAHMKPGKGIKAAGGIASLDDAYKFIELGATRLGTSRIVKLVKNEEATGY